MSPGGLLSAGTGFCAATDGELLGLTDEAVGGEDVASARGEPDDPPHAADRAARATAAAARYGNGGIGQQCGTADERTIKAVAGRSLSGCSPRRRCRGWYDDATAALRGPRGSA